MSVQLVLYGESNKMTCTCIPCGAQLQFITSLSPNGENKVFTARACECLRKPKAPEYKLCRNCGVQFDIPSFCEDCRGE